MGDKTASTSESVASQTSYLEGPLVVKGLRARCALSTPDSNPSGSYLVGSKLIGGQIDQEFPIKRDSSPTSTTGIARVNLGKTCILASPSGEKYPLVSAKPSPCKIWSRLARFAQIANHTARWLFAYGPSSASRSSLRRDHSRDQFICKAQVALPSEAPSARGLPHTRITKTQRITTLSSTHREFVVAGHILVPQGATRGPILLVQMSLIQLAENGLVRIERTICGLAKTRNWWRSDFAVVDLTGDRRGINGAGCFFESVVIHESPVQRRSLGRSGARSINSGGTAPTTMRLTRGQLLMTLEAQRPSPRAGVTLVSAKCRLDQKRSRGWGSGHLENFLL
ncbi:hypothetical protein GEV33_000945 [Tenebrio molitor]|uniref:Uncharacterized protein n=1 Tax=Tenebrio molitor TaxID=7067 RepID=A0A8J6HY47_TENMO|nr:hypothetical protein GEV33_000945 [Tenebrio molitor]